MFRSNSRSRIDPLHATGRLWCDPVPPTDFNRAQTDFNRAQSDFNRSQRRDFGGAITSTPDLNRQPSDYNRHQQRDFGDFGGTTYNQSYRNHSPVEDLLQKIRSEMKRRGSGDIGGIGRKFRMVDDDHNCKISRDEFGKMCNELSLSLNRRDIDILWPAFDFDNSGNVDYEEFLRVLRGEMSEKRQAVVDVAFDYADVDGTGVIEVGDLLDRYDADSHPDVKQGRATSAQVLKKFLLNFDVGGVPDGKVTREEFHKYYEGVSASCDSDDYFEQLVRSAWNIKGPLRNQRAMNQRSNFVSTFKQKVRPSSAGASLRGGHAGLAPRGGVSFSPASSAVVAGDLLERVRADLRARGSFGIAGIGRKFRILDDDGSGKLSQEEFQKMCRDCRLKLSPQDIMMLFKVFDYNDNGSIDYEEFLKALRGPMNNRRQAIVKAAFKAVDVDNSGFLDVTDLIGRYNASFHPDVRAGREDAVQCLKLFAENFDVGGVRDGKVTPQEFMKYYEGLSAGIDSDAYFEDMVSSAWNLNGRASMNLSKRPC